MTFPELHRSKFSVIVRVACLLVLIIILIAGLWPFHVPKNEVGWLSGDNGLYFGQHGSIVSAGPLEVTKAQSGNSCTIELWLQPARIDAAGTILAFYDLGSGTVPFEIRQFRNGMGLRHTSPSGANELSEIYVPDVLSGSRPAFVAIRSGNDGTSLYVDGNLRKSVPTFVFSSRDLTGEFVIGDAPANSFNWSGTVKGLAIYNRELTDAEVSQEFANWTKFGRPNAIKGEDLIASYLFNEGNGRVVRNQVNSATNLLISDRFKVFHQKFLERPWDEFSTGWHYWKDVAVNVIGFIPLGFCFRGYFGTILKIKRSTWTAIAFGFAVSLTIELLQSYLPTRDSGMTDLITNTSGTALGAIFCTGCLKSRWFARLNTAHVLPSKAENTALEKAEFLIVKQQ